MSAHQHADKAKQSDDTARKKRQPINQALVNQVQSIYPSALQRAIEDLSAATPETILQLQRLYGNRTVNRIIASHKRSTQEQGETTAAINHLLSQLEHLPQTAGSEVVQRRVALAKEDVGTPDFVELTSIDYAVKEAGGPVQLLKDSDLSKMRKKDVLFIVGHGAPGKIKAGGTREAPIFYEADQIVDMLFDATKGLQRPIKAIRFTSCSAGAEEAAGDPTSSIVAKIKSKLDEKKWGGVQVSGARGPSVKAATLGKAFTVIAPGAKKELAGKIQKALEKIHEPRKKTKDAIKQEEATRGAALTLEEKASIAARETADFYKEFVQSLEDPTAAAAALQAKGVLTADEKALLRLLKKAPGPLTLDPPMLELVSQQQKKSGCFITTACVEAKGLPDDCYELETLRAFRDGYIRALPNGKALIAQYYEIAPKIVARIKAQPNAQEILSGLYEQVIKSVKLIEAKNYEQALQNYSAIVSELREKYLHGAGKSDRPAG